MFVQRTLWSVLLAAGLTAIGCERAPVESPETPPAPQAQERQEPMAPESPPVGERQEAQRPPQDLEPLEPQEPLRPLEPTEPLEAPEPQRDQEPQTPPEAETVTVVTPEETTIERGSTAEIEVAIQREKVNGPVTVEFSDLPPGVKVVDETAEIEGEEQTFVLQADESADLVGDHVASVTLTDADGMTLATEEFRITVRDKAG